MNFDDLKLAWRQQAVSLDGRIHLDQRAASAVLHARTATGLARLRGWLWMETFALVALLLWLGSFVARRWGETAQVACATALHLGGLALLAAAVRQLVLLAGFDHGAPVVALQRQLEQVAVLRIRATCGSLVLGPLLWLPALAVVVRDAFGADLLGTSDAGAKAWIVANLAFGLAVVFAAAWAARRWGDRLTNSSLGQRLLRDLGGQNLGQARANLRELAAFARGDEAEAP